MNSSEIQRLIGENIDSENESLDLSGLEIQIIPKEIQNLYWLKKLNLSNNQIVFIENLGNLLDLETLDLHSNEIQEIQGIDELFNLKVLDLSNNKLTNIEKLLFLNQLENLRLANNEIEMISGLNTLVNLKELNLGSNNISKIVNLSNLGNLKILILFSNAIKKIEGLETLRNLKILVLSKNSILKIEGLENQKKLKELYLWGNSIEKIEGLDQLEILEILDLSSNNLSKIEKLEILNNLEKLHVRYNNIKKIEGINTLNKLRVIDLSFNKIEKVEGIDLLTNLEELDLSYNLITKFEGFDLNLKLLYLSLFQNKIKDISKINIDFLKKLNLINLQNNEIEVLPNEFLNSTKGIIGFLESALSSTLTRNKFVKLNILGEGRIGKTQLFNLLNKKRFRFSQPETHGTNTSTYKIPNKDIYVQLWDFGGQYYHHGFHQIFIRETDINLVLWRSQSNLKNDYGYWLGTAKNYSPNSPLILTQNVWTSEENVNNNDDVFYPDSTKVSKYKLGLDKIFYIDIFSWYSKKENWKNQHLYFLNNLYRIIETHLDNNPFFKEIPISWVDIKDRLDNFKNLDIFLSKKEFKKEFADIIEVNEFETLLFFLEFTGSIIYFHDNEALLDYIFVKPHKLSMWIYNDVLNTNFKDNNNGILNFKILEDRVGIEKASVFLKLMNAFNLMFKENSPNNNLVIPQFLPENNTSFKNYLLELIPYTFCIRFEDFFHEGRIFQFISEYGIYAQDNTAYWRYGLIFTKNGIKTLVYYEFESREIFIHMEEKKGWLELAREVLDFFILKIKKVESNFQRLSQISKKYKILTSEIIDILNSYGLEVSNNPNSKIPTKYLYLIESNFQIKKETPKKKLVATDYTNLIEDLFVSFNETKSKIEVPMIIEGVVISSNRVNYFDIKDLISNNEENLNVGFCIETKQNLKIGNVILNLLGMNNLKLPKVFISYSRKDLEFKEELKSHLSILERYDLLKAWSCDEIKSGKWEGQIEKELEEADFIIYMISPNFMASEYIMEKEVKKGIKLAESNKDKKIICVLVGECVWNQWSFLEEKQKEILKDNNLSPFSMNLSQFQFLPYHRYINELGVAVKEEIVALEQWGRNHYEVKNVAYKQIVSKILKEI